MSHWERRYYLIKTMGSQETLGFLSLVMPSTETTAINFTLHRPEHEGVPEMEFVDLSHTTIEQAEWDTHINAFETHEPLDVEHICWPHASGMNVDILLTRKEKNEKTVESDS